MQQAQAGSTSGSCEHAEEDGSDHRESLFFHGSKAGAGRRIDHPENGVGRKGNLRWRAPHRAALGSPLAFSFLELPPAICKGHVLQGFVRGVPNFDYSVVIEEGPSPYFGLSLQRKWSGA